MKGLKKVLTPFAPDQSGAVSVLYELGALIVIIDAGGCAGNICGFDEPRWAGLKSAVFSAGLRDMDAIMGRDDTLCRKIARAANAVNPEFIALIGTPVPAVTAMDYTALARMTEKESRLPVICVDTNGMEFYDRGIEKALYVVYEKFAVNEYKKTPGKVNILGSTEDDFGAGYLPLRADDIKYASCAEKNIVVSPAAYKTARLLKSRFNTPYETGIPEENIPFRDIDPYGRNILIVHQHIIAASLRNELIKKGAAKAAAATWFMFGEDIKKAGDIHLKEEDDFTELACSGGFDMIIADKTLKPLAKGFCGQWIDFPHFALSGRL